MPSRKPKAKRRWLRRLLIASPALFVVAMLVVVLARVPIANWGADRWLPTLNLQKADLEVEAIEMGHVGVQNVTLADPGWSASISWIRLGFSLEEVWKSERASTLLIRGAEISVERQRLEVLAAGYASSTDAAESEPLTLDLSPLFALPVDSVECVDGTLTILDPRGDRTLDWSASLKFEDRETAVATLRIAWGNRTVSVDTTLRHHGASRLELGASLPDALAMLDEIEPGWRTLAGIPPELAVKVGKADVSVVAGFDKTLKPEVELDLRIASLDFDYDGTLGHLSDARVTAKLDEASSVRGAVTGRIDRFASEEFELAVQPLHCSFASSDLRNWTTNVVSPLAWHYDVDTAAGVVGGIEAAIRLPQDDEPLVVSGLARVETLSVSEYPIGAFGVGFEGDLNRVEFTTEPISLLAVPSLTIANGAGSLDMLESGAIVVTYQGELAADAASALKPDLRTPPLSVEAKVTSTDDDLKVEARVSSKAGENAALARFGEQATILGKLAASVVATTDAEAILWDAHSSFELSELSAKGLDWKADGCSLSGRFEGVKLDEESLTADSLSLRELAEMLARSVRGQVDWQCSELAAPGLRGQWMGGSVSFGSDANDPSPALLRSSAWTSVGSLQVAGQRVQQISLTTESQGDFDRLASKAELQYRFEGLDGNVTIEQAATGLLDPNRSVEGTFAVAPLVFDYSDLLSRSVPSLQGLSFSGAIEANGRYWQNEAGADAEANLRFRDGSISYPASQVEASGIDFGLALSSAMNLTTKPGGTKLEIGSVSVGDIKGGNGVVQFDLGEGLLLSVNRASLELMGGELRLEPGQVSLNDPSYAGRLFFERLSLDDITKQISFFNGSMEGAISGYLPVVYKDGKIGSGEGRLTLASGTTAVLRYNAEGMLKSETPSNVKKTLGERLGEQLLERLDLVPEEIVEEALGRISIRRFEAELMPRDAPRTPIRIYLEGEATPKNLKIPVGLQVNVNGTLAELYNFVTRINSLGSVSF